MKWFKNHWIEITGLGLFACVGCAIGLENQPARFIGTLGFGMGAFFLGILCVWLSLLFCFEDFTRFIDIGHFEDAFDTLDPREQIFCVLGVFLVMFYFFIQCCHLIS